MTKYDMIYESLVEKVNNEELTLEEAQELNELAFEKYGDTEIEDDSVTLEEAMDVISDYLTEAMDNEQKKELLNSINDSTKRDRAAIKYAKKHKDDKAAQIDKQKAQYDLDGAEYLGRKIVGNYVKARRKGALQSYDKKQDTLNEMRDRSIKDTANATAKQKMFNKLADQGRIKGRTLTGKYEILDKDKKNVIKKITPKSVHESVDELRLQVYEAFESGMIEESTKDLFLTYLDLENYNNENEI